MGCRWGREGIVHEHFISVLQQVNAYKTNFINFVAFYTLGFKQTSFIRFKITKPKLVWSQILSIVLRWSTTTACSLLAGTNKARPCPSSLSGCGVFLGTKGTCFGHDGYSLLYCSWFSMSLLFTGCGQHLDTERLELELRKEVRTFDERLDIRVWLSNMCIGISEIFLIITVWR